MPVKAQPAYVIKNGLDILLIFIDRVCVIKTHEAVPGEFLHQAKIQKNRLGVPDVEIAVGFRRKSSDDLWMLAGLEVFLDDIADEVSGADRFGR